MVKKKCDDMLSRFHLIPERNRQTDRRTDGRTDGQTDRQTYLLYQYRASVCWRAIKRKRGSRKSAVYAGTRCPSVCLSVCPSITFVSCAKTNKDILEIFSLSGSHTILVFPHQTGWRYSNGTPPPLTGASNASGYEKIDDFWPIYRCISETVTVRWAHAARQFVSVDFYFHPYNI